MLTPPSSPTPQASQETTSGSSATGEARKQAALSLLRHALTCGGGYLVGRGIVPASEVTTWIPLIMTLVGALWGPADEFIAARKAGS